MHWWHLHQIWRQRQSYWAFLKYLNGQHDSIKLTIFRHPCQTLHRQDFLVICLPEETFTALYTKCDSVTPRNYKINLIRTLTCRCFRIYSSPSLFKPYIYIDLTWLKPFHPVGSIGPQGRFSIPLLWLCLQLLPVEACPCRLPPPLTVASCFLVSISSASPLSSILRPSWWCAGCDPANYDYFVDNTVFEIFPSDSKWNSL